MCAVGEFGLIRAADDVRKSCNVCFAFALCDSGGGEIARGFRGLDDYGLPAGPQVGGGGRSPRPVDLKKRVLAGRRMCPR